ncbi:MAG: GNVR domain-containing protein [bacterium]
MAQYDLNLHDYVRILRRRKLVIILTFVAAVAVSRLYVSREVPYYKAITSIKIEERKTIAGLLTEWIVYNPGDAMESAARDIKGFTIMKKVAQQLDLIRDNTPLEKVNNIVTELQGRVTTETIKQTNIIEITTTAGFPKEAMDLANTVAAVYVEENLLTKNKQARSTRQFIEEQLAALESRLRNTEEQLNKFGDETKNFNMNSPIQQKLVNLEVELLSLQQRYTEKHPQVKQIRDQIKELEGQLRGFSSNELEYARLNREVEVNRKLYSMLKEKLEEARITEAEKVGDVSIVDPAVQPIAVLGTDKRTGLLLGGLIGIVLGLILAFLAETMDTSIGTIEDVEAFTKLSVVGAIPSIGSDISDEDSFIRRALSSIFNLTKKKATESYTRLIVHHEPNSIMAEAYRSIRTNLKLTPELKTILVTSAGPREGKTTVVTNLGLAIAQTGAKTLLVSSDLRRPAVAKSFGLNEEPGLNEVFTKVITLDDAIRDISDIMLGEMTMDDILKTPGMENINILPCGRIPSRPAELLGSSHIQNLIGELKKRFDIILLDSPPVLPIADAILLASLVDGIVLVYEAGKTARSALLRAKVQLESGGGKIIGIVLNHIRSGTEMTINYPYYYRYKYSVKAGQKSKDSSKNKIAEN